MSISLSLTFTGETNDRFLIAVIEKNMTDMVMVRKERKKSPRRWCFRLDLNIRITEEVELPSGTQQADEVNSESSPNTEHPISFESEG